MIQYMSWKHVKVTGKKTRLYLSMSEAVMPNILFRSFMSQSGLGGGGSTPPPPPPSAAGGGGGGTPQPTLGPTIPLLALLWAWLVGVGIIETDVGGGGGTIGGGSG